MISLPEFPGPKDQPSWFRILVAIAIGLGIALVTAPLVWLVTYLITAAVIGWATL